MGWIYIAGLAVWLLAGGFRGLPIWLIIFMLAFSFLLIWNSFRRSRKLRDVSEMMQ